MIDLLKRFEMERLSELSMAELLLKENLEEPVLADATLAIPHLGTYKIQRSCQLEKEREKAFNDTMRSHYINFRISLKEKESELTAADYKFLAVCKIKKDKP